ncbi:MAG: efflux RND transporter periplasmic adaptor subunit [Planctomycetes bacterium]|nr:efflux RND transporter periplasmic adaptor subunit [Planctomycetota bacterium]
MRSIFLIITVLLASLTAVIGAEVDAGKSWPEDTTPFISIILTPKMEVSLSSEVSSTVTSVVKEMGGAFKKGDTLVVLDDTLFQARSKKAKAEAEAKAVELQTAERLFKDKSNSALDLIKARKDTVAAEADLVMAEHALSSCTIKAPFDGKVVKILVREHELVKQGQEVIRLVDDSVLLAKFLCPSQYRNALHLGDKISFTLEGAKEPVTAKITNISPVSDAASGTIETYAEIDNADQKLKGGLLGKLSVESLKVKQDGE